MDKNIEVIDMPVGGGGKAMHNLIAKTFLKAFDNKWLNRGDDFADLGTTKGRIVISTDGHVVNPLFFPGGDIGSLAVHGTINDISVSGATPLYLTCGFIIEEGLPVEDLKKIVASMAKAASECGVSIVTGDTKVVERGKGDGIFITTTGIGVIENDSLDISGHNARAGDKILINGFIGDHGVAILSKREELKFDVEINSDSAPLNGLIKIMTEAVPNIHCLRDPTRGGVAITLNEIASQSKVTIELDESQFPIRPEVSSACEFLGLDPLYSANEGKVLAFCPPDKAEKLLESMKKHPLGRDSKIIGEVLNQDKPIVQLRTQFGGKRILAWQSGEQLPRIC